MCNLYRLTSNVEAVRQLSAVTGELPNLPLFPEIRPKGEAPVIRAYGDGQRHLELARWGIAGPGNIKGPITNIRNLASPFWRHALGNPARRCLVPVTGFLEWTREPDPETGRKRKVWFEMADGEPFVFAGIVFGTEPGELDRFAFLTCAPNTVVGAIHPKAMPVILHGTAKEDWLTGDAAKALALPVADELMRVSE